MLIFLNFITIEGIVPFYGGGCLWV